MRHVFAFQRMHFGRKGILQKHINSQYFVFILQIQDASGPGWMTHIHEFISHENLEMAQFVLDMGHDVNKVRKIVTSYDKCQ
jgi:hypothetical protein